MRSTIASSQVARRTPIAYYMQAFLINLLRQWSNLPASQRYPGTASKVWSDDPATSTLVIESVTRFNEAETERRPAILVKRNSCSYERIGLTSGQVMGNTSLDGTRQHSRFVTGSHSIFTLSTQPKESELLAMEVSEQLGHFNQEIRRAMCLFRFDVADVSATSRLREAKHLFATAITVGYVGQESYIVYPVAPRIGAMNTIVKPFDSPSEI